MGISAGRARNEGGATGTHLVQRGIGEIGVEHASVDILFVETVLALNEAREDIESPLTGFIGLTTIIYT